MNKSSYECFPKIYRKMKQLCRRSLKMAQNLVMHNINTVQLKSDNTRPWKQQTKLTVHSKFHTSLKYHTSPLFPVCAFAFSKKHNNSNEAPSLIAVSCFQSSTTG